MEDNKFENTTEKSIVINKNLKEILKVMHQELRRVGIKMLINTLKEYFMITNLTKKVYEIVKNDTVVKK